MKIKNEHYASMAAGHKVPRKVKKFFLGKRFTNSKIKRLLKKIEFGKEIRTMYERREILPFAFCPKCGCRDYVGYGNMAEYPEHWEDFICLRCRSVVASIDNSPFVHVLENMI